MSKITIPAAALEAGAKLLAATNGWKHDNAVDICKPVVLEIIAAALAAWPGMHLGAPWVIGVPNATSIILPLTEKTDG